MVRRLMAAVSGALVLLTGLFLALAPFALVQRTDHSWTRPTLVTVVSAGALAVLGLVVVLASIGGLLAEVHARYPETVRKPEPKPTPAPAEAEPTRTVPLDSVIGPMIAAYQQDLAARGPETPLDTMLGRMLGELGTGGTGGASAGMTAGLGGGLGAGLAAAMAEQSGPAAPDRGAPDRGAAVPGGPAAPPVPEALATEPVAAPLAAAVAEPAVEPAAEPFDAADAAEPGAPAVTGRAENVVYIGRARVPGSTERPDPPESLAAEGK
jgi:hypothetical protein